MTFKEVYYDILIWLFEHLQEAKSDDSPLRLHLISGLTDDSESVSNKVFEFWEKHLSDRTIQRLLDNLSTMYLPEVEDQWLNFTTRLLLNLTKKSPDFDRVLFEPLTDAEFKEYHIDTSVQSLPGTLVSASQGDTLLVFQKISTYFSREEIQCKEYVPLSLRSSLSLKRESQVIRLATHQTASNMEFSQSAQNPHSFVIFQTPTISNQGPNAPRQNAPRYFNDFFLTSSQGEFAEPSGIVVRKRFQKTTVQASTKMFARKNLVKRQREAYTSRNRTSRNSQVVMYRSYRTGELPDIQIKPKDLIEPLQALAKKESTLARLIFSQLFKAIITSIPEPEKGPVQHSIARRLEKLLQSSVFTTPFVGCLLGICFEFPENLSLSPHLIGGLNL